MRLIKRVDRMEAAAAAAREPEAGGVEVVWSDHENRIDARTLGAGEFVAVDVVRSGEFLGAGLGEHGEVLAGTELVRITERVTTDPRDLGWVLAADGEQRIGEITRLDGALLEWEMYAEPEAADR